MEAPNSAKKAFDAPTRGFCGVAVSYTSRFKLLEHVVPERHRRLEHCAEGGDECAAFASGRNVLQVKYLEHSLLSRSSSESMLGDVFDGETGYGAG